MPRVPVFDIPTTFPTDTPKRRKPPKKPVSELGPATSRPPIPKSVQSAIDRFSSGRPNQTTGQDIFAAIRALPPSSAVSRPPVSGTPVIGLPPHLRPPVRRPISERRPATPAAPPVLGPFGEAMNRQKTSRMSASTNPLELRKRASRVRARIPTPY